MTDLGYTQLKTDYCCYTRGTGKLFAIVLVWVDDLITFTENSAEADLIEKELTAWFDIKCLGEPSMLLGIKISRDKNNNTITLSQTHYIDSLLKKFGLENAKTVATPLDSNVDLDDEEEELENQGEREDTRGSSAYAPMIGSALYAALGTRSDIMYAIQRLAQFTAHPKPKHWTALKRIFRYLKGTRDYALTYGGFDQEWTQELSIYCDARLGIKRGPKISQRICYYARRRRCRLEFEETTDNCIINGRSGICSRYSCNQTSSVAPLIISGTRNATASNLDYIFG